MSILITRNGHELTSHKIQNRIKSKNTTTTATIAAILAEEERKFKYLASFLYFDDSVDRLLAFVSNTEINKK